MNPPALEARFALTAGGGAAAFELQAALTLHQGVLALFGPSGSGKSLTVQALAGLVRPHKGSIRIGGRLLFDGAAALHVPPHRRGIGYVPQHHSLFPFRDVTENVMFGLPRRARRRRSPIVQALLSEVGLTHLARARPEDLSGGERQRVALARALAVNPQVLLLDEPFASIDVDGRAELRGILQETLVKRGTPAVIVTHDRGDIAALADRVVRFERGRTVGECVPADLVSAQRVRLRGEVSSAELARDEGRSVLRLDSVEIQGPASLLAGVEGHIDLELQAEGGLSEEVDDG